MAPRGPKPSLLERSRLTPACVRANSCSISPAPSAPIRRRWLALLRMGLCLPSDDDARQLGNFASASPLRVTPKRRLTCRGPVLALGVRRPLARPACDVGRGRVGPCATTAPQRGGVNPARDADLLGERGHFVLMCPEPGGPSQRVLNVRGAALPRRGPCVSRSGGEPIDIGGERKSDHDLAVPTSPLHGARLGRSHRNPRVDDRRRRLALVSAPERARGAGQGDRLRPHRCCSSSWQLRSGGLPRHLDARRRPRRRPLRRRQREQRCRPHI